MVRVTKSWRPLRPVLRRVEDTSLRSSTWAFHCPGCGTSHRVSTGEGPGPRWTYNGDPVRPTFSPSLLITWHWKEEHDEVCHSYITDGFIRYLDDCTHALAGQTVALTPAEV